MDDLALDLQSLRKAYAAGLDPTLVIDGVYARIEKAGDPGIFITLVDREAAIAAARALRAYDPGKPLWGVPFAVKDNIDVAGLPTTAAGPAFAYHPAAHAPVVEKLFAAGAILIGKTNLDQFATGLVGTRTPYPVPLNPFDRKIIPGGSSAGSAVAVARELVSFALGTDTAGSGRVPAGLNNIVGLKPSVGAVSTRGVVPACRTLDVVSVFALTVDDAWDAYAVIAGPDNDPFSRPILLQAPGLLPPVLRLGIPRKEDLVFFGDQAAEAAWHASLSVLEQLGVRFVEIDMRPFLATAKLLYEGPWVAERHAAIRTFFSTNPDDVYPVTRSIIEGASKFSATDAFEAWYALAARKRETEPVWQSIDALVVPTMPNIPTIAEVTADPFGPNARLGTWTNFVNLLDLAALAVPGPFRSDGLPAGITLIGPRASDAALASLGRVFHMKSGVAAGATGRPLPALREVKTVRSDLIEIVVVGAHLSGMPLNNELKAAGGIFRRAVLTKDCYQLYALAGGPPKRPGLLRVADGTGHAIATEVWVLPEAAFGCFVAGIPAPLGIGTLRLQDGTLPKGFLVEPEGLSGAQNISRFGGWRAFIAAAAA